ncbi:hypothetical protein OIU84_020976 [Salix udensis]|uniref:Uncharacterized protein n=1 Tax=Salix udensis TaxID=889485 RepID=A0AAD6PIE4_9ROSI|nr:hypothetical protein OIU84_020976 [Salix udensis]
MGIDPVTHKPKADSFGSGSGHSKGAANLSHMAQWESARLEAEARLVRESKSIVPNPPQNLLGSAASARLVSSKGSTAAPAARPQCLDVLKAWQGVVFSMFSRAPEGLRPVNLTGETVPYASSDHNGWFVDSPANIGNAPGGDIIGLSEILGSNSQEHNPSCSGENINESYDGNLEENRDYWNSLLNLVGASPTGSAVF